MNIYQKPTIKILSKENLFIKCQGTVQLTPLCDNVSQQQCQIPQIEFTCDGPNWEVHVELTPADCVSIPNFAASGCIVRVDAIGAPGADDDISDATLTNCTLSPSPDPECITTGCTAGAARYNVECSPDTAPDAGGSGTFNCTTDDDFTVFIQCPGTSEVNCGED